MNYSFINVIDFLPDFLQEITNGFPNIQTSFGRFLLHLVFGASTDNNLPPVNDNNTTSAISLTLLPLAGEGNEKQEHLLKRVKRKYRPDVKAFIMVDDLVPYFMKECAHKFLSIDKSYASYLLHLLVRDFDDGLDLDVNSNKFNVCKLEHFLYRSLTKYADPLDATSCSTQISYYFKGCLELKLDYVKKKYELNSKEKLYHLCRSIMQYPENSNLKQLDEMFVKMQIFIITNYCIGSPENSALLKQARQSLNSVLGKGDLQKYLLKKRYHRLEYLQKLGATVCGILIFNNYIPQEKNDDMRNIFIDLEMAQRNTKESLDAGLARASLCIQKGTDTIQNVIKINVEKQILQSKRPLKTMREVNKFIVLFHVYKRCLGQVKDVFEKTIYLIGVSKGKFDCVIEKINEILKFRSAIESELIFPHFVYLSEVWSSLILYLNHLVEVNKIKDHLDKLLNENVENRYNALVDDIYNSSMDRKYSIELTFEELMTTPNKGGQLDFMKLKPFVQDYCALTMTLTNGLLVPSQLEKRLCENVETIFGFDNIEFAKYTENAFSHFIEVFGSVIFTSVDLILLYQLDDYILKQDFDLVEKSMAKKKAICTQTKLTNESNLSPSNRRISETWNVWDYHRETIRLANIRQQQTNSTQTSVSFGKKNSQNESVRHRNVGIQRQN